jgi:hypothetical protein
MEQSLTEFLDKTRKISEKISNLEFELTNPSDLMLLNFLICSLSFVALRLDGVNPVKHRVYTELNRIREYMAKLEAAGPSLSTSDSSPQTNKIHSNSIENQTEIQVKIASDSAKSKRVDSQVKEIPDKKKNKSQKASKKRLDRDAAKRFIVHNIEKNK